MPLDSPTCFKQLQNLEQEGAVQPDLSSFGKKFAYMVTLIRISLVTVTWLRHGPPPPFRRQHRGVPKLCKANTLITAPNFIPPKILFL